MCQVWLLGASLGWLHLILQARGLPRTQAASSPTNKRFLTFALSVPFVCDGPALVLPHPQVSVQSQLLGRSSSPSCASGLPTFFSILCLSVFVFHNTLVAEITSRPRDLL